MKSSWRRTTFREAGVILIDCDHRTPPAAEEGYPYVAIPQIRDGRLDLTDVRRINEQHFQDWTKKLKPQADDVIVVRRCNSGESAVVPSGLECAIGQNLVVLRSVGDQVLPRFLRWLVRSPDWWENVRKYLNVGAVFDSLKCRDIPCFEMLIPPVLVQKQITEILNSIDDRIVLAEQMNETLQAIASTIFKSWFIDFDPVRAKAHGRKPEQMDAETATLFPDEFEEAEGVLIPKGWTQVPFGQILDRTIGGDWGQDCPDQQHTERVAIVRGTDIPTLQKGMRAGVPVRYVSPKKLASRKLIDGDIVLEVSGGSKNQPTGRSYYFTEAALSRFDCPMEPASFCRLFRAKTPELALLASQHLSYIYSIGKTWTYQNQSTGISNFQTAHFLDSEMVTIPPVQVQQRFFDIVRPLVTRTQANAIEELTALRDTLLPRLISGQLRVPEAQEAVEEAIAP